jgi:hypothetical protein
MLPQTVGTRSLEISTPNLARPFATSSGPVSTTQSFYNCVQYGVDNLLNVTLVQVRILGRNALYQF